jgi:hypothetical protein
MRIGKNRRRFFQAARVGKRLSVDAKNFPVLRVAGGESLQDGDSLCVLTERSERARIGDRGFLVLGIAS